MKIGNWQIENGKVREWSWRALVFVVAATLLVVVVTRWTRWEGAPGWQTTDDAYLQADVTPISARVTGYVRVMPVQDYQRVRAGQLIVELVDVDYRAAVAQAQANLGAANALIVSLEAQRQLQAANVEAARSVLRATQAVLAQNDRDLARQRELFATGSSSTEAAEKLQTTKAQLIAQRDQNNAQVEASERQLGVLAAQQGQAEAALAAQQALLDTARINLGYTRIVAPQDGVLGLRQVRLGQLVGVGGQVTTLTPLPRVWVIANYKETQLTHMAVSDNAEIRVDTFPGHVLRGHVIAFSPGSGSQFTLLPPDNATGNFTKVVQRIAVKIVIDDFGGLADRLRPGMSVIAEVNARDGQGQ